MRKKGVDGVKINYFVYNQFWKTGKSAEDIYKTELKEPRLK